jgi:hypothetical protein
MSAALRLWVRVRILVQHELPPICRYRVMATVGFGTLPGPTNIVHPPKVVEGSVGLAGRFSDLCRNSRDSAFHAERASVDASFLRVHLR